MADQKPLFKAPYDIKDVSALFAIVAFVLIISAIVGNNLFGLFQLLAAHLKNSKPTFLDL